MIRLPKARNRVALVALVLLFTMVFGTGAAYAGTLTVRLVMNPVAGNVDGVGRTVYVYGPSGYYRAMSKGYPGNYQVQDFTFYNAPNGAYRIRVTDVWGRDRNNQYPSFNFNFWNGYSARFQMQR